MIGQFHIVEMEKGILLIPPPAQPAPPLGDQITVHSLKVRIAEVWNVIE